MPLALKAIITSTLLREAVLVGFEVKERHIIFQQAREYADGVGKPLLVVGSPKWRFSHPCGDVTIDISPERVRSCDGEVADIRAIPYPDKHFGAAFVSHVLEHLPSIEDAFNALDELERVADSVFTVSPHKSSLIAWVHPSHHLWVTASGDGYIIEQRHKGVQKPESYLISARVLDGITASRESEGIYMEIR